MLMVRATEMREDSVQKTLHMETILLLNAERFGKQRGAIAGDLPSHIVSPSKFLVSLIVNNSSVQLVHLPLGDKELCGISPHQISCIARTECGFQNISLGPNVAPEEVPPW